MVYNETIDLMCKEYYSSIYDPFNFLAIFVPVVIAVVFIALLFVVFKPSSKVVGGTK